MSVSDPIADLAGAASPECADGREPVGRYAIAGWHLASAFPIPALPFAPGRGDIDIEIVVGTVPARLDGDVAVDHPVFAVGKDGTALLTIPGLLRILIENGRRVTVHILAERSDLSIGMLLHGPVLAILARQRGLLPFQGSAVRLGDGAVALLGSSGCGKSVLAAMLAQRGHEVLSDGLCLLAPEPHGVAIRPLSPVLRLWRDAREALGIEAAEVFSYRSDDGYGFTALNPASMSPPTSVPLKGTLVLGIDRDKDGGVVGLRPFETIGRLSATLAARPALVGGPLARHLGGQLAAVAAAGPVVAAHPAETWEQGARLVDAMLNRLGGGALGRRL